MSDVESWLPVAGFDGVYDVSDWGRIRTWRSFGRGRLTEPKVMSLLRHRSGYAYVNLQRAPIKKAGFIHRLVLEAFVGPCPAGMEACHADGDRMNSRLDNLRWDTREANAADRIRHGRAPRGTKVNLARLNDDQVADVLARLKTRESLASIAKSYGVGESTISAVAHGRTWLHVPAERIVDGDFVRRGEEQALAKLTEEKVREARILHAAGETFTALAARYGVSRPAIANAITRRTWAHVA